MVNETREQIERWWNAGDEAQRRHALRCMGPSFAHVVEAIAADSRHPFYVDAITAMTFGFEQPRHQGLKLRALKDPRRELRLLALDALLTDEPIVAEEPLLEALADPDLEVANLVLRVLGYYPTRRVFRRCAELLADARLGPAALLTFEALNDSFSSFAAQLGEWLDPVRPLLRANAPTPAVTPRIVMPVAPPSFEVVCAALQAHDTRVVDRANWPRFTGAERDTLRELLLLHDRERVASVLQQWGERDGLFALTEDPLFTVRKSAYYELAHTPPFDERSAQVAWTHLQDPDVYATHWAETLAAYVKSAPKDESVPRLLEMAHDAERAESMRIHAVNELRKVASAEQFASVLVWLERPPPSTWGFAIAILEGAARLQLSPNVEALRAVDHLELQLRLRRVL